jgi:hypothetical protein
VSALSAGIGRAVITPPIGIPLVGFAGRGPAEAVHDELLATTLVLEAGGTRAAIITADVIGFGERLVGDIRAEVERRTGLPGGNVLLCASHTHYGPKTGAYEPDPLPPDVEAYTANLKFLLAGTVEAALARLQPVRLGFGQGEAQLGVNRRERRPDGQIVLGQNPAGPCDRSVGVTRLDAADGTPLAALVSFACHPVSAGARMREISADWVGVMRGLVESATGAACLYLQGAGGNINPVEMRHSFEPARRLGLMLGGEVVRVLAGTESAPAIGLSLAATRLELPAMRFAALPEGEAAVAELTELLERQWREGASEGALWWTESRLERAARMCDSLRTGVPLPGIPAELCALRFGDVALATAPGEIFTETGTAVKQRSPLPRTCFTGYANGTIGYVPVPSAYAEGGYEVTHACRVAPEAAGMIEATLVELLRKVTPAASASGCDREL